MDSTTSRRGGSFTALSILWSDHENNPGGMWVITFAGEVAQDCLAHNLAYLQFSNGGLRIGKAAIGCVIPI